MNNAVIKEVEFESNIFDFDLFHSQVESEIQVYQDEVIARWYQTKTVARTIHHLINQNKRILIVLPTGAGKTHTSRLLFKNNKLREFLNIPDNRPLKLMFVTHKHRLAKQAIKTFDKENNIEFISQSAFSPIPDEIMEYGWDITCIDEAHHEAMHSFQMMLDKIGDKPLIGLTATPTRSDAMMLKFEQVVAEISRRQAVEENFLAKTYLNSVVDTGGKYKTPILKKVFSDFADEMGKTIIFVRTKKECMEINEHLQDLGYSSIALLNQNEREIDSILDDFSNSKYQFIINCQKISEGVDVKGCDTVILGRQFNSYSEINQSIGRASRPDSDCNVWQLINPLRNNLNAIEIVGKPEYHRLISYKNRVYKERFFGEERELKKVA